jgi:ketosteroid isomerase-like protein
VNPRASFLAVAALTACISPDELSPAERRVVAAQVDSATRSFQAAERDRDAERIVAHLAPEFYMYNDGVRAEYPAVVENIRATMPSLRLFEPEWRDIEVTVLGRNGAVVSFVFEDLLVTGAGDTLRVRGPTTLVWRRQGQSSWLVIYADADHYPAEVP